MVLDPLTVTAQEAEAFFSRAVSQNAPLIESLSRYVKDGFVFFDIGANAGYFSKMFLSRYEKFRGTAVLFEPIRNLSGISQQTLEFVRNADVYYVNSALGRQDGDLVIHLPTDSNIGWITAVSEFAENMIPTVVRVSRARRYVERFRPDIIKIDVEGYESQILWDIIPLINASYRPALLVELNGGGPLWPAALEVAGHFYNAGYEFRNLDHSPVSLAGVRQLTVSTDALLVPWRS